MGRMGRKGNGKRSQVRKGRTDCKFDLLTCKNKLNKNKKKTKKKTKITNSIRTVRPPAATEAGPVQAVKDREDVATVGLYYTYPLQSDADPLIRGTVVLDQSDNLSDVSMDTKAGSEAG